MTIKFMTTNPGKLKAMREHVASLGITVEQAVATIIEPQADTPEEIAISKAQQAFAQLKHPVAVEDGAFCIDELHGFPGPYAKYVLQTVGAEGVLQIAARLKSRKCHFESALAYIDSTGKVHTFVDRGGSGTLADKVAPAQADDAWSDLWRIYIPAGASRPISVLAGDEREAHWEEWRQRSTFRKFGEWLKTNA
jgi:XTP/dITP diphosphohydrolase